MSDTPISDSTAHNVADLGMLCRTLERLAVVRLGCIQQLETDIERLTAKVAQLYEGAEEQKQRIKRLEEAGDELICYLSHHIKTDHSDPIWHSASIKWGKVKKEAKL